MTIDEAITRLLDQIDLLTEDRDYPLEVALKLGVQALQCVKIARASHARLVDPLLEGETKE